MSVTHGQTLDFWNLQWPSTGTQFQGGIYDVYAQVYEPGVTDANATAAGAGIMAWIGFSSVDATTTADFSSSDWTWVPAIYNQDVGNNDEFWANIGPSIQYTGTYYYASRFQYNVEPYVYGGILADGSAGNEWDGITYISGVLTITCPSTTTWDGAAWDNGNPDASTAVIINGTYSTSVNLPGSFEACSLTVNALDASAMAINLDVQGTDYISVVNDIIIDGTITVATEASLVQIDDNALVTVNPGGDGVLQKTTTVLTAWYDYTYWSSPVSNETIGSVFALVPANRIYEYDAANFEDTDSNGFDDDANDWSIASGTMTPGKGYAAVAEDNFFDFPQINTMTFNGQFNNGVITPVITMSPGPNPLNWNFLGNPYPSPIDADLFLTDPANATNLGGSLYFWVHNLPPDETNPGNEGQNFSVDDYAIYNMSGGTSAAASGGVFPSGIIATGQGFFVEALSAGTAVFNNSMRVETGNTNFYKTSDRIWLDFKNDYGAFSQILIGFNENATNGYDRLYDGKRLDANSFVSFFSFIDDEKYAIQSKAQVMEEEIIPLGIMTTIEDEMEYSISIDKIEGILETSDIYLIDNYLNVEHNLNESAYTFLSSKGDFNDRFALSLKTEVNVIDTSLDNELIVSDNLNGYIDFTTTHQSVITNVKIFDILGRLVNNVDFNNSTTKANLEANSLNNSIFIVKITIENGNVLTKKILK